MINPDILKKVKPMTREEFDRFNEEYANSPEGKMTLEDVDMIMDQMERMGGGNLIGRPSPYDKKVSP